MVVVVECVCFCVFLFVGKWSVWIFRSNCLYRHDGTQQRSQSRPRTGARGPTYRADFQLVLSSTNRSVRVPEPWTETAWAKGAWAKGDTGRLVEGRSSPVMNKHSVALSKAHLNLLPVIGSSLFHTERTKCLFPFSVRVTKLSSSCNMIVYLWMCLTF